MRSGAKTSSDTCSSSNHYSACAARVVQLQHCSNTLTKLKRFLVPDARLQEPSVPTWPVKSHGVPKTMCLLIMHSNVTVKQKDPS